MKGGNVAYNASEVNENSAAPTNVATSGGNGGCGCGQSGGCNCLV